MVGCKSCKIKQDKIKELHNQIYDIINDLKLAYDMLTGNYTSDSDYDSE